VSDATFATPDLSKFCRVDELGLEVTGRQLDPERAVLACRVRDPDGGAIAVESSGGAGHGQRRLAHEPCGWRPTTLVTVSRYGCTGCAHV